VKDRSGFCAFCNKIREEIWITHLPTDPY
jgi:hypothetical protein